MSWFLGASLAGFMLLGISGAIAALGDTLFPASSVAAGIAQDASPGAHIFVRLRVLHPVIAIGVAFLLTYAIWRAVKLRPDPQRQWAALGITILLVVQIVLGAINIGLLAPIWLQIIHLFVADVLWISLILYSASAVATLAGVRHPAFA
jgi:heme A synthase